MQIACIHRDSISEGFLSTLGSRFLALLYESIDRAPDCVLIVIRVDGKIVGFVSGGQTLKQVYKMMLGAWGRLFMALLPAMLSPRKLHRIAETVLFSNKNMGGDMDLPPNELLSIAVSKEFRGQGFADQLFNNLVDHFRVRGVEKFKIVVGEALQPAHKFYRRMGAYPVAHAEVHKGSRSTVYVRDVF